MKTSLATSNNLATTQIDAGDPVPIVWDTLFLGVQGSDLLVDSTRNAGLGYELSVLHAGTVLNSIVINGREQRHMLFEQSGSLVELLVTFNFEGPPSPTNKNFVLSIQTKNNWTPAAETSFQFSSLHLPADDFVPTLNTVTQLLPLPLLKEKCGFDPGNEEDQVLLSYLNNAAYEVEKLCSYGLIDVPFEEIVAPYGTYKNCYIPVPRWPVLRDSFDIKYWMRDDDLGMDPLRTFQIPQGAYIFTDETNKTTYIPYGKDLQAYRFLVKGTTGTRNYGSVPQDLIEAIVLMVQHYYDNGKVPEREAAMRIMEKYSTANHPMYAV